MAVEGQSCGGLDEAGSSGPLEPSSTHAVVLFYKYVELPAAEDIEQWCRSMCQSFGLVGRLLVASEGINGTLSARVENLSEETAIDQFIVAMEQHKYFGSIDWKRSVSDVPPFPDLVVKRVSHLVAGATGTTANSGVHLSPEAWDAKLRSADENVVLVDVRNAKEHAIGRFETASGQVAIEPRMKSFGGFERWIDRVAPELQGKTVMMYCTGGIRCEKASAMLRNRGVDDVSQLKGGIHRYFERFPDGGLFKGKNFVFDKRVAISPPTGSGTVVGVCSYCSAPYDELHGSRICTVCRDLVLCCASCHLANPELHCDEHFHLKDCFRTFIDHFSEIELTNQIEGLKTVLGNIGPGQPRNRRRLVVRQIEKVERRRAEIIAGAAPIPFVPRCRSCELPSTQCNGYCWGFWKESGGCPSMLSNGSSPLPPAATISVGATVERGPGWNSRYGSQDGGPSGLGEVVELKAWGSGGSETDAVKVRWKHSSEEYVYRWGVIASDGTRIYDVKLVTTSE